MLDSANHLGTFRPPVPGKLHPAFTDDLCPGFRERLSAMLDAYKSHRTDVHDTQGPRDEGVDVQLNYQDEGQHRLGLQVKSFDEIEAWARGRDSAFIKTLKAQYATAIQNAKMDDYYLLLCTDEIRHKDQIRLICSEMKQFERLKIVLPRQALALFEASDAEIQGYVTRLLCSGDSVLQAAIEAVEGLPADYSYILLALICRVFKGRTFISQEEFFGIYEEWEELNPGQDLLGDRLPELVSELDGKGLSSTEGGDSFVIDIADLPPALCAMYFDQRQRNNGDPMTAMTTLLGIRGRRRPVLRRPSILRLSGIPFSDS